MINLLEIKSGYNVSKINSNFDTLQNLLNNQTLLSSGGQNVMSQNLDMNGWRVLNIQSDPSVPGSMVTFTAGDARYYRIGDIPTAVGANDAVGLNQMNLAIAAAAGGTFPANVALYSVLAASTGATLIGYGVTTVKAQLDTNAASIGTLNTNVASNTSSISTLNTTVSGHTSSISTLNSQMTTANTNIGTNTSNISTLNTTVSGHTTSIGTINGQISTLQGQTAAIANLGKVAIAGITADQSMANNSAVQVVLNTFTTNTLGATFSSGAIVIPAGVSKIRITASISHAANATGVRQLLVNRNGSPGVGLPLQSTNATSAGATTLQASSPVLSVSPGDTISLFGFQNSGGALAAVALNLTWLAVEAIN